MKIKDFAIKFAEYIAKEHYVLVNIIDGFHYWQDEYGIKTTQELLKEFKEETKNQLTLTDVSDKLILTPKDAQVFFNEIMNPKEANEALKKAMLKFINR